jgi:hypothetical protein
MADQLGALAATRPLRRSRRTPTHADTASTQLAVRWFRRATVPSLPAIKPQTT